MVTTRSADKRLDTSRAEDLVLRSRTVGSPSSAVSTPSRSQKRTASARENIESLRSKRVRTETDGNSSSKTSTHVVVNVPVVSINRENHSLSEGLTKDSDPTSEARTTVDNVSETEVDDGDQATPNAKVITAAETPNQGGETFQTPVTSRHKRFDSEEPEDDTIIVSATIDSSAPHGYHTAEEEIADSDDNDEAPVVESTKIAPRLPQRKSTRTAKGKNKSVATMNTASVNDETIGVAPSQTETEPPVLEEKFPVSYDGLDQVASVKKPRQETLEDTNLVPPASELALSQPIISSQPSMHITHTLPTLPSEAETSTLMDQDQALSPSRNQEAVSGGDADIESVAVSDSTLQDLSSMDRSAPSLFKNTSSKIYKLQASSFSPQALGRSAHVQIGSSDLAPIAKAIKLPAKATSGLSDYRRRRFQQKVAGSAGGFKMQNDWPKKRSSFVVS